MLIAILSLFFVGIFSIFLFIIFGKQMELVNERIDFIKNNNISSHLFESYVNGLVNKIEIDPNLVQNLFDKDDRSNMDISDDEDLDFVYDD